MDCVKCGSDNLTTDYPVCPTCAATAHFTYRNDCRCDECAEKIIEITIGLHGKFEFKPPRYDEAFLEEFKLRIGRPFRFWNTFREIWQITPLDAGMVVLIGGLLEKHFHGYRVALPEAIVAETQIAA